MKKKLLQINTVVNLGSTGRIAEQIGALAIEKKWDSYIAFGRNPVESKSKLIKIGSFYDVIHHIAKTRLFDLHGLESKTSTKKLIEDIKLIKPDIVHIHNLHGYYINYKILFDYLKASNAHVVWTMHDCWPFTGHCAYYDFVGCNKWQKECFNCEQKKKYPSSLIVDRSKKNYYDKLASFTKINNLTLVPVSNWLNCEVKKSFLKNVISKVIHNGVDTNIFKPTDSNKVLVNEKPFILGVAGDWVERKGLLDFIKLSEILPNKYTIILIGLTASQIKKLPKNIIGLEKTQNLNELVSYYSKALVFFNPTYEDNFPTTNIESLSCGTPIITYNTGGSPEAIDNKTGFIVEKGALTSVLNCIENIYKKGKNSLECRERAIKMFDKNNKFNEYFNLYNKILKNAKK